MSGKGADGKKEECGCYAESRTPKACPPVRNVTHPLRYYEFTQEEIKALEECDKESFYHRCLPFSAMFATATYAAIKYASLFYASHCAAAALVGHVCGRVAYVPHCEEKLRRLPPASYLGKVMRQHYDTHYPPPKKK